MATADELKTQYLDALKAELDGLETKVTETKDAYDDAVSARDKAQRHIDILEGNERQPAAKRRANSNGSKVEQASTADVERIIKDHGPITGRNIAKELGFTSAKHVDDGIGALQGEDKLKTTGQKSGMKYLLK